jgi:valyl-tRNA synthetase
VQILRSEAFDPDDAARRLADRVEQLTAEVERAQRKHANERNVEKAPAQVVEAEREKLEGHRQALERLSAWTR